MQVDIRQYSQDFYGAAFDIMSNGRSIGNITFEGSFGSLGGDFKIHMDGYGLAILQPANAVKIKNTVSYEINYSMFRPYVLITDIGSKGVIFHDQIKTGFLATAGFHVMEYNDIDYFYYHVGRGEEGLVAPVYKGDDRIGYIHKPAEVKNGLHNFKLEFDDEKDILVFLAYACYVYAVSYYRPGEKVTKGIERKMFVTKDKFLLSK